ERYLTNDRRAENIEFIDNMIQDWTMNYPLKECVDILNNNGIPAGAIYSIEDMLQDPQYKAREMIVDVPHPDLGSLKVPGIVPKLDKTTCQNNWLGTKIGKNNLEMFQNNGLKKEQKKQIYAKGII